jgi:Anti-sigma-28 factor, FlgM
MSTDFQLHPVADPGIRARPADPPAPERVHAVARKIRLGSYRVKPELIAASMLRARDPLARRD